jgi:sphingomyelin phosphodiesterase acid-like 3
LDQAITEALNTITPDNAAAWCGYRDTATVDLLWVLSGKGKNSRGIIGRKNHTAETMPDMGYDSLSKTGVSMSVPGRLNGGFGWVLMLLALAGPVAAVAQAKVAPTPTTASVVMLSDLHFDPFHDPAKVPLLVKATVEEWEGILKSPDSAGQEAEFAAVQKACKGKQGVDAPYLLLSSALQAAKAQAPDARFVTVSGDLLVHDLDCRYRAALNLEKATEDDQSVSAAFAEKTTVFVMKQVESTFKGVPVYLALGNNDSRCNHNRLDMHDVYLKATGQAVIDGLVGVSAEERKLALATYNSAGYYGVTMAAPMKQTRLLVLDDIYMMSKFANCEADDRDRKGAQEQIVWLTKELEAAEKQGEQVWVLGHVPPAVDPVSTLLKGFKLCASGQAETYLSSNDLATTLANHEDVVQLALFGHTHMDEMHVLRSKGSGVPVKVVASVSAVDGNTPSFTVGTVAPISATLTDYAVYEASNATGVGTTWTEEYDFDKTYHEASFSAKALDDLIGRFRADSAGTSAESQAYQRHFFKGIAASLPGPLWMGYVCSMDHPTADEFKVCVCGGK